MERSLGARPLAAAAPLRLALLLLAASAALASRPAAGAGRRLQQTGSDCASVPNCVACRFQAYKGTTTRAMCTKCANNYSIRNNGLNCWCAPGFYADSKGACQPCGKGSYCMGAKLTAASAVRTPCGKYKTTQTLYASVETQCVVNPGYSWGTGDTSTPCSPGTYNPGFNNRKCTPCPAGLSTADPGQTSIQSCVAPPGYYYYSQKAIACARGFYKEGFSNSGDCNECPEGFTTADWNPAATSKADCNYVTSGYAAFPPMVLGNSTAAPCPVNTYRTGDAPFNGTNTVACTPCPTGTQTKEDGATSVDACMAPPGSGYDVNTSTAAPCPTGSFNPGWNREPCTPCGLGTVTTDGPGSNGADDCKVPAGHSGTLNSAGVLVGAPCPVGTFGSAGDTYGLSQVQCATCPDHSTTLAPASTSSDACVTDPGYGWYSGSVEECDYGFYSPGGTHNPCIACGGGGSYNTTRGGNITGDAITGATSRADCVIAAGWTRDGSATGGLKPCQQGWYKSAFGPGACTRCPDGTTSTLINAAAQLSDCNACRPGFGSGPGGINPAAPSCTICPSGNYSFGGVAGGQVCGPCPQPSGYSGRMVSIRGAWTPESCVAEFNGDGSVTADSWNIIPMDASALSATADASVEACQAACAARPGCQYFAFYEMRAPGAQCLIRDVPAGKPNITDPASDYVMFEVKDGVYVSYYAHPTDAASLGDPLDAYATLDGAVAACSAAAACLGVKYDHTLPKGKRPWKTFAGILWEAVTGKVRVTGQNLNSWVSEVSPNTLGFTPLTAGTSAPQPVVAARTSSAPGAAAPAPSPAPARAAARASAWQAKQQRSTKPAAAAHPPPAPAPAPAPAPSPPPASNPLVVPQTKPRGAVGVPTKAPAKPASSQG